MSCRQKNSSYGVNISTPGRGFDQFERASKSSWDDFLPITRRGNFYQDSFFSNTHQDFDDAIRKALNKWNDSDLKMTDDWDDMNLRHSNTFDRYKQMRSRNQKEENQAITVTSDNHTHKIMLDVHDFKGNVKVKVVGDRELVVEGRLDSEDKEPSFRRRFSLPQLTDMSAITSVLSLDGVLTITAPKTGSNVQQTSTINPAKTEETRNTSEVQNSSFSTTSSSTNEEMASNKANSFNVKEERSTENVRCSQNKHLEDDATQSQEKVKVPIVISGPQTDNVTSQSGNDQKVYQNSFTSSQTSSFTETSQDGTKQKQAQEETGRKESNSVFGTNAETSCKSQMKSSCMDSINDSGSSFLPITRKGLFFSDSFFQDTRKDFRKAVQDVLTRWGEESSITDDLTSYRNLRTRDLREDNQAVTSSEDEHCYKFIMDVQDFLDGGEVNVKAVDDVELVVEGHRERKEDGSKSAKKFFRRFALPRDIQLEDVTSVMSSDGVLTISVPKKKSAIKNREDTEQYDKSQSCKLTSNTFIKHESDDNEASSSLNCKMEDLAKCDSYNSSKLSSGNSSSKDKKSMSSYESEAIEHNIPVRLGETSKYNKEDEMNTSYRSSVLEEPDHLHQVYKKDRDDSDDSYKTNKDSKRVTFSSERDFKYEKPSYEVANRILPIYKRGLFSDDGVFVDVRANFSQAVKDVLEMNNEWYGKGDAMQTYRDLRKRNLKLENQAFCVTDDHHSHKVVVDVYDFMNGEVTVQLVEGTELLVQGHAERQEGTKITKLSFVRRFAVPPNVDIESISCSLSTDGVLTIVSRKRGNLRTHSPRRVSSERNECDAGRNWEERNMRRPSMENDDWDSCKFKSSFFDEF